MAKIISYPTAQPKADDFVLGAQVSDPGEPIESPTKKFSISSIIYIIYYHCYINENKINNYLII